jgi:predicted ATPase/DNA-binding SARP family transcriptional activator
MPSAPPSGAGVSYQQQYRRCGKQNCKRCATNGRGHGPYWYAVWWDGSRTRSHYLGKAPPELPAARSAPCEPEPIPRSATASVETPTPPALRVRTLGGFAVWCNGEPLPVTGWGHKRAGMLFKWLVSAPGHRLTRDEALDLLWPETEPETAATNLRVLVHRLRRALGEADALLRYDGRALALAPDLAPTDWLDAEAFAQAANRALATRDRGACHLALGLYGGDYLPEDPYEEWALRRREELRSLRLRLLLHQAACAWDAGAKDEAAAGFQAALVSDPCSEEAAIGLMRIKAATGQPNTALRVYHRLVEALREELNLVPGLEARSLAAALSAPQRAQPSLPSPPRQPNNIPSESSGLIGRGRDLTILTGMLAPSGSDGAQCRMLTLVGPGGVGKTRLSLALAEELLESYPDGAWQVDLSGLPASADGQDRAVARSAARVLDVQEGQGQTIEAALADALRSKRLLLLLDNCEHVIPACAALVGTLLAGCPTVQIVATSRETLGVAGEQPWAVPALSLPSEAASLEALAEAGAVRLFLARARAQRPGLELTKANAAAVAAICRGLDGLPLALELAAARVATLGMTEIADRLQESLRLLTIGPRSAPARQRTLQATLDWSYMLLTDIEQVLLRHLAVFASGCTLDAVSAIAPRPDSATDDTDVQWAVVDGLDGLARKSLLQCEDVMGAARYRLLETVRHYAAKRLATAGESDAARDAHLRYYLALAEQADAAMRGPEQGMWLARLDREHDNLRAALRWAAERGLPVAELRLAAALGRFWHLHGYLSEGQRRLEDALIRAGAAYGEEDARLRGKALRAAGVLASDQGDYARAVAWYEEGLALLRAIGDTRNIALILNNLGNVAGWQGDYERAMTLFKESLALLREVGDKTLIAAVLGSLGSQACDLGDMETAVPYMEESLALQREMGDQDGMARTLTNLGLTAHVRGDLSRAASLFEEGLAIKRTIGSKNSIASSLSYMAAVFFDRGDLKRAAELQLEGLALRHDVNNKVGMAGSLEGMASYAQHLGEPERAVRFFAAATAARERIGAPQHEPEQRHQGEALSALRDTLGEAAFARAWAEGTALTLSDAVAEALTVTLITELP